MLEYRPTAVALTRPFQRFFTGKREYYRFAAYCLRSEFHFPDGRTDPWPTDIWPLSAPEQAILGLTGPRFEDLLCRLAVTLAKDGVPLDPRWVGDQFVLAQLLLCDVDFGLPKKKLARQVAVLPPATLVPNEQGGVKGVQWARYATDRHKKIVIGLEKELHT